MTTKMNIRHNGCKPGHSLHLSLLRAPLRTPLRAPRLVSSNTPALCTHLRIRLRVRSRRGVASSFATVVAIPVFLVFIGFILYFGRLLYVRAAAEDAAAVGSRWAVTSLSGTQGCTQARQVMQKVFDGYNIDPSGWHFSVNSTNRWGRGHTAEVVIAYRVNQAAVPFFGSLLGNPSVSTRYIVPIDAWNNRYVWSNC